MLPPLVDALRRDAPHVDLRVTGYDKDALGAMPDRGEIDLALGVFPDPPQNAVKSALFEERFVGVARRDHPAVTEPMSPETFAALPQALVSVRRDASGMIDAVLGDAGLKRRIVLVIPHMAALPAVLLRSDLVAALPARVTQGLDPGLASFELPIVLTPWQIDLLWNPNARNDKAAAWLRRLVVAVSRNL